MKRTIFTLLIAMLSITAIAQNDVTKFLGIPVDGTKTEMIRQLKAKGFTPSPYDNDVLTGEFNGYEVNVHVVTNNNKVYRIMLVDANFTDATAIRIRFNRLCEQFNNNQNYIKPDEEYSISASEDFSYEILVHNKRYEASYYQKTENYEDELMALYLTKYTQEQIASPTEEIKADLMELTLDYLDRTVLNKSVWFMIDSHLGQYRIIMYYDNLYNQANGEDL